MIAIISDIFLKMKDSNLLLNIVIIIARKSRSFFSQKGGFCFMLVAFIFLPRVSRWNYEGCLVRVLLQYTNYLEYGLIHRCLHAMRPTQFNNFSAKDFHFGFAFCLDILEH